MSVSEPVQTQSQTRVGDSLDVGAVACGVRNAISETSDPDRSWLDRREGSQERLRG